jgi:photosystem II stability/assembly factor-like uncharacterized protein
MLGLAAALVGGTMLARPRPAAAVADLSGDWDKRYSPTSRGTLLLNRADGVYFYDPAFDPNVVRKITNSLTADMGSGFTLGSGALANQVIAAWRNGTDFAYFWTQTLPSTTLNAATGPFNYPSPLDSNVNMNPEWVGVADGCVFLVMQHFDAGANSVKNVFKVDNLTTGAVTNLTNTLLTPGAPRVQTSNCQAAWIIRAGTGTPQLQFYDGAAVRTVDTGALIEFHLAQGRLLYTKTVSGVDQVFGYDSAAASPGPVQLSFDTTGDNMSPTTDGRHVAWIHANGGTHDVVLGGVILTTDPTTRHDATEVHDYPLQFQRGQLIWKDTLNRLLYHDGRGIRALEIAPTTDFDRQWLGDGFVAFRQTAPATLNVLATGVPPGPVQATPLALVTTPGNGQATVNWDRIVGASAYVLYAAHESGLRTQNWYGKAGGRRVPVAAPPFTLTGLQNGRIYRFVVSAVIGGAEGPGSRQAEATLLSGESWLSGAGTAGFAFAAVAADPLNPDVAYAGGNNTVYKSTDGGATWAPLAGLTGQTVKALAVLGNRIHAVTESADIWRSTDGGGSWTLVADGTPDRGPFMSIATDPLNTDTLYAGSINMGGPGDSFILKSTNGGASWSHVPAGPVPGLADLIPYAIALDPVSAGRVFIGGSGEPVARSTDGGSTWTTMGLSPANLVYSLTVDPRNPNIVYAGTGGGTLNGVYQTYGDRTWLQTNGGLPGTLPQINALGYFGPDSTRLQAGTSVGYFSSLDGGQTWTAFNAGLGTAAARRVNALAGTASGHILAATDDGVFQLDLSAPATMSLAVRGADNGIYHNRYDGATWLGWTQLPGATLDSPALAMTGGMLDLVVRGTDNSIYHNRFDGASWLGWTQLPGAAADTPAVAPAGSLVHLVVRGIDSSIYHNRFDGTNWLGWVQLPGAAADAPALASGGGTLELVVRGSDSSIYHNRFDGVSWLGWVQLPGAAADAPALASTANVLHLLVRGSDSSIYHNRFDGVSWLGWVQLPGAAADAPAAAGRGTALHVVVRGADSGIYHNRFDGTSWLGWAQLPGATPEAPALSFDATGTLHLVVRGLDGSIYHNRFVGSSWVGFTGLPGAAASRPAVSPP